MTHRILFVIEDLFPLGAAEQLHGLAQALVQRNHVIHIAVLGQREFEPQDWLDAGIEVSFLNSDDKTPLHTMRDGMQVVTELRSLIQKWKPEIVHSWCGIAELLTLLAANNYTFLKRHERFRLISTELFKQPEKRFIRKFAEERLTRRVERMIVPHQSVKNHLVEEGYREHRINIVPNGLFETTESPDQNCARRQLREELGIEPTDYVAGTVAVLEPRTRLKDLIWATDLLVAIRDDFHFVIVGTGPQLRRLKRFAALTEAKLNVHFLGHPENSESVIDGLDFYWHSHFCDPLSSNLMMAMSKGIPVVSVYGDGTREMVRSQQTAFAVNFGARDEFARWTKFFIEQVEPSRRMAKQGQAFVRDNFPSAATVDGYLGIYDLTS